VKCNELVPTPQQSTRLKITPQRLEDFVIITNCANIVDLVEDLVLGLM
jgi:hypothetical protein